MIFHLKNKIIKYPNISYAIILVIIIFLAAINIGINTGYAERISLESPIEMKEGTQEDVILSITKNSTEGCVLNTSKKCYSKKIPSGTRIRVELAGSSRYYDISPGEPTDLTISEDPTEFLWQVTPLHHGMHKLCLKYSMLLPEDRTFPDALTTDEIKVNWDLRYFLENNWDKLIGIFISGTIFGAILALWNKLARKIRDVFKHG